MRDSHRLKEKFELSLDNRQVLSLVVVSLVVLGGVFFSGVVVGKKMSAPKPGEAAAPDILAKLDEKNVALEIAHAPDALTFQDELTRKQPTATIEAPRPVEVPIQAPVVANADVKVDAENEIPKASEPVIEKVEKVAQVAAKPEVKKVEPVEKKVEAIPTRTHDGGNLKEAFGKVQKSTPETSATGNFTLQLSAYQDKSEADKFASLLRNKGYAPYVIEAAITGKGTWYRVRMGRFSTKEAASKYMDDFKRETSMNAIVTSAQ
jgi:DedD protein